MEWINGMNTNFGQSNKNIQQHTLLNIFIRLSLISTRWLILSHIGISSTGIAVISKLINCKIYCVQVTLKTVTAITHNVRKLQMLWPKQTGLELFHNCLKFSVSHPRKITAAITTEHNGKRVNVRLPENTPQYKLQQMYDDSICRNSILAGDKNHQVMHEKPLRTLRHKQKLLYKCSGNEKANQSMLRQVIHFQVITESYKMQQKLDGQEKMTVIS